MEIDRSSFWPKLTQFLIQSAHQLEVPPVVKYTALYLFAHRFYPSLTRYKQIDRGNEKGKWLLQPVTESNLQLFTLVSIWISSKIHDSRPLSLKTFKSLGDKIIKEQHFTTRDFLEAEIIFLQVSFLRLWRLFAPFKSAEMVSFLKVLDFEIGTSNIAFLFLEDLFVQFKEVAKVGELVNFEACMDLLDLLYEKEEATSHYSSISVAASILVAAYIITVPKQKWEFPVLPWVKFVTSCNEDDTVTLIRDILKHVFTPG